MRNFDQILTFIEVADSGSFAEASRRLDLATSTTSARIKALEDRLTVRLFHRNTRRVTLTEEGERYLAQCRHALRELLATEDAFLQRDTPTGTLRVTVPVDFPYPAFTRLLGEFSTLYPHVEIEVIVTDELLDLVEHRIDIAFRGNHPGSPELIARPLGECALKLYASPHYCTSRLGGEASVNVGEHSILDPLGVLPSTPRTHGVERQRLSTSSFALAREIAIQSQGIALLPAPSCLHDVRQGALMALTCNVALPRLPVFMVFHSRAHLPPRVRAFVDFIVEHKSALGLEE